MDCIILGNGSSLKDVILPDLPSFGCNFIGRIFQPTFFVCIDGRAIRDGADELYLTAKQSKRAYLRDFNSCDPKPNPLYALPNVYLVNKKSFVFKGERTTSGGTTVYLMLKIAYYAGYDRVYLYGVDHTLEHFSPDYPSGVKPDLVYREWHYRLAAKEYAKAGKQIINMSAPSVLDNIFQRPI